MKVSRGVEAACLRLAGGKPKRRARPKGGPKLAAGWAVELSLPCTVVSELNRRDHWAVKKRRGDVQRQTLRAVLREFGFDPWYPPAYPVRVTFTRVGGPKADAGDNLNSGFKALRDELAAWLGIDDGDGASATWHYRQESGTPGVRVRIEGI